MIKRHTVLTLRDLRGEEEPEVRTIPWDNYTDFRFRYTLALIELAGVAMQWRKDDRYPAPAGRPAPRDEAVLDLVRGIASVIVNNERLSLCTADCSLVMTWEPAEPEVDRG